ncbi:ribosome production factor 2 [Nematocida sp. AWRm80]|nr:ribosome production factor 2 [Nematocida sp. AWRm80]
MGLKTKDAPQTIEPPKRMLVIASCNNSPKTKPLMNLLLAIKKHSIKYIDTEGECMPRVDNSSMANGKLEEQMKRHKASLFAYIATGKNDKIRLILGRSYEYQLIDIAQFTLPPYTNQEIPIGHSTIAVVLMNGRLENDRTQNLILDIFRDTIPPLIGIPVCTTAIGLTVEKDKIEMDILRIDHSPFNLVPVVPKIELTLTGTYHTDAKTFRESKRTIRQTEKAVKNVEKGPLSSTIGTLHIQRQQLSELELSKSKAFRNRTPSNTEEKPIRARK